MLRRFKSFQNGTLIVCRSTGCKVTSCQSWRFEKNSAARLESNHTCAVQVPVLDNLIILKISWTVTLQPFDLQRLTLPFWKDLDPIGNKVSAQETGSILKISFALSISPHLLRAYSVPVCNQKVIGVPELS